MYIKAGMNNKRQYKLRIGVSSCLLGQNVRYDGSNKKHSFVTKLCETFDCVAICPEYRIGMGVPRSPINLVSIDNVIHAQCSVYPHLDVTAALKNDACNLVVSEPALVGYVFKARSPSCGVNSTPFTNGYTKTIAGYTSGIFSEKIRKLLPNLPIIEEENLTNEIELKAYIDRVLQFAEAV